MPVTSPRASSVGFPVAKLDHPDEVEHRREIARVANLAMQGKLNVLLSVTLTANAATTTVSDPRLGSKTMLILAPTTSNAAAAISTTYQTYPNTTAGSAVLNHANNAQTDRTFIAALIG